jgi:hypothetical protein
MPAMAITGGRERAGFGLKFLAQRQGEFAQVLALSLAA